MSELDRDTAELNAWLDNARTPVVLWHIAELMQGRTDPYYGHVRLFLSTFAERHGWVEVLKVLANRNEVTL